VYPDHNKGFKLYRRQRLSAGVQSCKTANQSAIPGTHQRNLYDDGKANFPRHDTFENNFVLLLGATGSILDHRNLTYQNLELTTCAAMAPLFEAYYYEYALPFIILKERRMLSQISFHDCLLRHRWGEELCWSGVFQIHQTIRLASKYDPALNVS
jgi:hypothetical protein